MLYVYFNETAKTITVSPDELNDVAQTGPRLGLLVSHPTMTRPRMQAIVHTMLLNRGYRDITGLTLHYLEGPELP